MRHVKPAASRKESVESYVLATDFHGDGLYNGVANVAEKEDDVVSGNWIKERIFLDLRAMIAAMLGYSSKPSNRGPF